MKKEIKIVESNVDYLIKANTDTWLQAITSISYQQFADFWEMEINCKTMFEHCLRKKNAELCKDFITKMPLKEIINIHSNLFELVDSKFIFSEYVDVQFHKYEMVDFKKFIENYHRLKNPEKSALKEPVIFLNFLTSLANNRIQSTTTDKLFLIDVIERAIKCLENSLDNNDISTAIDLVKSSLARFYYSLQSHQPIYKAKLSHLLLGISPETLHIPLDNLFPIAEELTLLSHRGYWQAIKATEKNEIKHESHINYAAFCDINLDCHIMLMKSLRLMASVLRRSIDQADIQGSTYQNAQTIFLNYLDLDETKDTQSALSAWLENPEHDQKSIIENQFKKFQQRSQRLAAIAWPDFAQEISHYFKSHNPDNIFLKKLLEFKFKFEIAAGEGNVKLSQTLLTDILADLESEISSYFFSSAYVKALQRFQGVLQRIQINCAWEEKNSERELKTIGFFPLQSKTPIEVKHNQLKPINFWQESKNRSGQPALTQIKQEIKDYQNKALTEFEGLLVELGNQIIELDKRSQSWIMVESARTNLLDKKNELINLYAQFKDYLAGRASLQDLSCIINQYFQIKPLNTFCYFFGTSETNLFASSYQTNTLILMNRINNAVNKRLDGLRSAIP